MDRAGRARRAARQRAGRTVDRRGHGLVALGERVRECGDLEEGLRLPRRDRDLGVESRRVVARRRRPGRRQPHRHVADRRVVEPDREPQLLPLVASAVRTLTRGGGTSWIVPVALDGLPTVAPLALSIAAHRLVALDHRIGPRHDVEAALGLAGRDHEVDVEAGGVVGARRRRARAGRQPHRHVGRRRVVELDGERERPALVDRRGVHVAAGGVAVSSSTIVPVAVVVPSVALTALRDRHAEGLVGLVARVLRRRDGSVTCVCPGGMVTSTLLCAV